MAVGPTLLLQSSASQRDPDRAVKAERAGKALLQPWCSHPCHKPLSLRGLEREAPPTPAPGGAAEAQSRGLDRRRRAGGTRSRGSHLLSPCLGEGEAGRVCLPHRGVPEGQSERRLPWSLSQPHLPQIILPHPSACVHSQTLLGAREQGPVFICKETAIEEWNFSLSSCVSGKPSSSPPQPHRTIWVQVSGPGGGLPRKSLSFLRHPCPHGYQAPLPEAHPLQAKRTTQICPGSWARPCRAGLPR